MIALLGLLIGLGLHTLKQLIYKAYDRVWNPDLLHKRKSYWIFGLVFNFEWFWNSSQEYPVTAGVPWGSIRTTTVFLLYINDLSDDVICNIATYADDTTFDSKCDQTSDLWGKTEIESYLWDTADWEGGGLLTSMLEKLNWFHLTGLITLVLLMWKWVGMSLKKDHLLRWDCLSLLNWIVGFTLSPLLKLPPTQLKAWLVLLDFFRPKFLFVSINLLYSLAILLLEYCCHLWVDT